MNYIVAGCKPWSKKVFDSTISKYDGSWYYASTPGELEALIKHKPDKIFFLHWNWKVPVEIIDNFECICFHPTALPYGRGGTPIQNLIMEGHEHTTLTAFRMIQELDAGDIYLQVPMSLHGTAEQIYVRLSEIAAKLIKTLKRGWYTRPQGYCTCRFSRRTPEESEVNGIPLCRLYDFIRMLDAEGYPKAFIIHDGLRIEFSEANYYQDKVTARVEISESLSNSSTPG